MTNEKIFAEGFSFKRQENAPDFVVGRLSMKVDEAIAFLRKNEKNGWVNVSIKYGRSGTHTANWTPTNLRTKQTRLQATSKRTSKKMPSMR
jgi:hypothetical protein